jgi:hypothetical protein
LIIQLPKLLRARTWLPLDLARYEFFGGLAASLEVERHA